MSARRLGLRLGMALGIVHLLAPSIARAGERDILFWAPYAAGTPEQAATTMDGFARYVEAATEWPPGSVRAAYVNSVEDGRARVEEEHPAFVIVPVPVYLRYHAQFRWKAIEVLVTEAAEAQRYSVYGPPGSSLASLAGAPLFGDAAYDREFVARIVLGRPDGDLPFKATPTSRPLSAVRRAAAGETVAVLLDEGQRRALDALPPGIELALLAESPWMPAGILAAGPAAGAEDVAALSGALEAASGDPRAEEILRTMRIRRFEAASGADLAALRRTFAASGPGGDR